MTSKQTVLLRDEAREEVPLIVVMLADDMLGATGDQGTEPLQSAYAIAG